MLGQQVEVAVVVEDAESMLMARRSDEVVTEWASMELGSHSGHAPLSLVGKPPCSIVQLDVAHALGELLEQLLQLGDVSRRIQGLPTNGPHATSSSRPWASRQTRATAG